MILPRYIQLLLPILFFAPVIAKEELIIPTDKPVTVKENLKSQKPRLTVLFVIDQFAYHYWIKLDKHFQHGLKRFRDEGVVYTNAYFPHACPATATGHTALNTGTYAKDHGIVSNSWLDHKGKKISSDDGSVEHALVFTPLGNCNYGKSPQYIMVNGISDQFVLADTPDEHHYAFSVSVKSRAAICTANKLGKALWIDSDSGLVTTSKAYFKELPPWLVAFNKQHNTASLLKTDWKLVYEPGSPAYRYNDLCNYVDANAKGNINWQKANLLSRQKHKKEFELFFSTPEANELTFRLAKECIKTHISSTDTNNLLLWVCISGLDKAGHMFGPESIELIDMIYHLDRQLDDFMSFATTHMQTDNVLFGITADHGIESITELLNNKGMTGARRIRSEEIIKEQINQSIQSKYTTSQVIRDIKQPNVYLNRQALAHLPPAQCAAIITDIKHQLLAIDGIKKVWTYQELSNASFERDELENYFKQQLFPGRSGDLIVQTYPYVIMNDDEYSKGTSHQTPYEYDTHVPLILYNKATLPHKTIHTKVWTLQLANTLAQLLQVSKPSASTAETLPGILG